MSVWELVIQEALQPIDGEGGVVALVAAGLRSKNFSLMDGRLPNVVSVANVPAVHQGPYDRLLMSPALDYGLTLVNGDGALVRYPVKLLW